MVGGRRYRERRSRLRAGEESGDTQRPYRVVYREAHTLMEELADATVDGTRKAYLADLATVPLLIIDDLGMRKLPHTAAEDLLEVFVRRHETASTLITTNRPTQDWGVFLGDVPAATAILDRFLAHAEIVPMTGKSYRLRQRSSPPPDA